MAGPQQAYAYLDIHAAAIAVSIVIVWQDLFGTSNGRFVLSSFSRYATKTTTALPSLEFTHFHWFNPAQGSPDPDALFPPG